MEIILLERVARLGNMGDVVTVKHGFARNFLLPQGKALRANKANLAKFESQRADLEAQNEARKKEANGLAGTLDGTSYIAIRQASDTGQLYGSVTTRDIANLISEGDVQVSRNIVRLDVPIKVLGLHTVSIDLHPEVETKITINVARSEDEAELQARGEDVSSLRDDDDDIEEDVIEVEKVFEDEDVAREAAAELSQSDDAESAPEAASDEAAEEGTAADEGETEADDKSS